MTIINDDEISLNKIESFGDLRSIRDKIKKPKFYTFKTTGEYYFPSNYNYRGDEETAIMIAECLSRKYYCDIIIMNGENIIKYVKLK